MHARPLLKTVNVLNKCVSNKSAASTSVHAQDKQSPSLEFSYINFKNKSQICKSALQK